MPDTVTETTATSTAPNAATPTPSASSAPAPAATAVRQAIHAAVSENPSIMLHELAAKHGVSEAEVCRLLPDEMRAFARPADFEKIWDAMTTWEKTTFIISGPGAIAEVKGKLPKGRFGHGFFNLMEKGNPLGGHLMVDKLGGICFLTKPIFGLESLSVLFHDTEGQQMFGVYAGREKREIIPSVKAAYLALREEVCE